MPSMGQPRSATTEGSTRPPVRESLPDLILALLILWPTLANRPAPLPLLAPQAATVLYLVLLALCCGAIAARRLAPLAGVLLIGACLVLHLIAFQDLSILMILTGLIAVETTQSRLDPPWRWVLLAGAALGASIAILRGLYLVGGELGRVPLLLVSTWMAVALAAFVGAWRRRGRDRFDRALERAAVLEAQQDAERRLAVAQERQRIARDVHDVLGHSLSVIAMQAEGARAILAADPQAADQALAVIGDTSRRSVDEVHALVDMLRADDDAPPGPPSDAAGRLAGHAGGQVPGGAAADTMAAPATSGLPTPGGREVGVVGAGGAVSSAVGAVGPVGHRDPDVDGRAEPRRPLRPGTGQPGPTHSDPTPSGTDDRGGGSGDRDDVVEILVGLVRRARRAGLPVGLSLGIDEGCAPSMPAATGLALERAAQESLTNALRHAPGAVVRVALVIAGDSAELTVTNTAGGAEGPPTGDGSPTGTHDGEGPSGGPQESARPRGRGGFGLIAMRERVEAAGGALSAGPTSHGGWRVRARLPLAEPADPPVSAEPPASAEPSGGARPDAGPERADRIGAPA